MLEYEIRLIKSSKGTYGYHTLSRNFAQSIDFEDISPII